MVHQKFEVRPWSSFYFLAYDIQVLFLYSSKKFTLQYYVNVLEVIVPLSLS